MAASFDNELWELPPEGTDKRARVLKLVSLVARSKHPHILSPVSISIVSTPTSASPSLLLRFPRPSISLSLRDAAKQGLLQGGENRRSVAFQLLSTVAFLHDHGIYHNFLTSDEVLLVGSASSGGGDSTNSIRLTHFFQSSITPVSTASYMCSRNYRPPEIVLGYKADSENVDSWLLGCLLFEVATGDAAFSLISSKEDGVMKPMLLRQQLEQIVADIGPVAVEDVPADFTVRHRDAVTAMKGEWNIRKRLLTSLDITDRVDEWDEVLRGCFAFHPTKRFTARDLLKLPLFAGLVGIETAEATGSFDYDDFVSVDEALTPPSA